MQKRVFDKKIIEKYILKNYSGIKSVSHIKHIEHNNINSENYVFRNKKQNYILKVITDKQSPEKIEKIGKILKFCVKRSCKIPEPILNNKKLFFDTKNNVILTEFFDGHGYQGTDQELKDVAKNIAILHKVLADYPNCFNYKTNSQFYKILKLDDLSRLTKILSEKNLLDNFDKNVKKNLKYIKSQIVKNEKFQQELTKLNLKKQLIHHDLHPENIIFKNGKVQVIIDFIDIRKGFRMEDVAFAAFRFTIDRTNKKNLNKKNINLFLSEYSKHNDIYNEERELFYSFLRRKYLSKISFILKKRYFSKTNSWLVDFDKSIQNLKLIENAKL